MQLMKKNVVGSCHIYLQSVRHINSQRIVQNGLMYCGYRMYAERQAVATQKILDGTVSTSSLLSSTLKTKKNGRMKEKTVYDLAAHIEELFSTNNSEEVIPLITSFSPQKEGMQTASPLYTCESLIAVFLYSGCGESAFTLWRLASTSFDFSPSCMTLMMFAVYTLLVDGKVQEAHDLMAMAALNSEGKGGIPAAASSLEYVKDWMVVYAGACMQNNEGVVFPFIKEGRVEVEEKIKTAFINILRLSLDVVKKRKIQLSRERLQMTLYATISLMRIYESEEHSKKLREILRDYTFSSSFSKEEYSVLNTLLYVADILIRMGKEKGKKQDDDYYSCFFPEDVSFLITYMFPLPLIYSSDINSNNNNNNNDNNNNNNNNESTPQRCLLSSTGLQMYQSLLFVSSSIHQEEEVEYKNTVPSSSSSMYTTTVGAVVLKWILENHFETLFFFSIVSYDMTTTTTRSKRKDEQRPLMGELIEMFIGNELSDVVSCKLGKQILPLIHAARNETSWENSLEDVDVYALVYISHILSSFINVEDSRRYKNKNKTKYTSEEDNDNDNGGGSSGGKSISVIGRNHIFYIELLASIIKLISDKNLKSWYRFVSHVTYEVTRENHYSSPTVVNRCIEGELQLQLHKRWWLPMLLMYVDKEREEFLCMQLLQKQQQRDSSLSSSLFHELSEWDHCVCVILYILHRSNNNNNNNNESTVVEKTTEISHDVRRLLVCRFVRWEWFLKSLFDLAAGMHNTGRETYYNKWSDLLHVCIQALQNCRKYYRRDIAKEFIEVMFFPFPPPSHLETHRNGSRNTTIHFLELLINGSTHTNSHHHESSFMFLQLRWSVVHEISRWLHTSHENWDYMRALHSLLPIGPYDETQRFLSLQYLIEDLAGETNNNKRKNKMITMMYTTHPGKREEERVCKVFHWYEESYRKHLSFITPQLLFPLARAMRRASLVDTLSKLVRDTFLCIQSGFHAPRPLWPSRLVEETLQFFYIYHDAAVMRMNMDENKRDVKNISTSLHHNAMYDNGRAMMIGFIETYLLALWEHEYFTELGMILLKADSSHTRDSNDSPSVVSSWSIHKKKKKDTGDYINIYLSAEVVYLLPVAEREALRVLLLLTFAQQCEEEMYVHALRRLPRNKADPEQVAACIHRLAMEEGHLFASLEGTAKHVVRGGCRLREACASMTALQRNVIGKQKENKINIKKKSGGNEVRTVRDLNRCIDRCDWATALQAIPQILTEPLHVARKALLACEKAPKGTAWEGAMNIFLNSKYTWESSNSQEKEKEEGEQRQKQKRDHFAHKGKSSVHATTTTSSSRSYHSTIGVQECGRVMTLLADAKRWRESLAVFASLGPRGVDAYTFSQACFSLRAGGHAELAIDLWASWRAIVGDYVEPTASMCGNFIRCGVVGNTAMADAACILLKTSLCNHAYMKIKKEGEGEKGGGKMHTESFSSSSYHHVCTPGTTLPLCMQDEEGTVIALLRDRCNESWQEALRLALASGRPRVIDAVARESPRNYHVYECLMQHAVRGGRRLSLEEKSSIVGHLNVKAALASENNNNNNSNSGPAAVDDRAVRLLQELLGDDDDKEREEEKGVK